MMKTKTNALSALIGTFILMISIVCTSISQGSLAISIEQSDGTTVDIGCGSFYTTLLPHEDLDDNETLKVDTWTLINDGDENLTIQIPLIFAPGASSFLRVASQPQGTLAPGESTTFTTTCRYNPDDGGTGFLPISTNSPTNGECGFNVTCSSINLAGTCDCANLRNTTSGEDLFVDTLRVTGLPRTDVIITEKRNIYTSRKYGKNTYSF